MDVTPSVGMTDSTYSLSASQIAALTADSHNVLVEEFTGQSCTNSPAAHELLTGISSANPGRLNIICLYLYGIPQCVPPVGSVHDLRDSIGTSILTKLYPSVFGIPIGGIDRLQDPADNKIMSDRLLWRDNIDNQLKVVNSVNVSLTSSYDAATLLAKIVTTITYTQPVSFKHNLTVVLVEDGIKDVQELPNGVFRDMLSSSPVGDPVLNEVSVKTKGTVVQRTFIYKLKAKTPAIIPDSCRVIAFVNSTSDNDLHILQSAQTRFNP